uniref:Uncharacterized protein n=1 Tax=Clastoptera arizonana TaxID=38151 RepID=A0A1B6CB39_9HEMI
MSPQEIVDAALASVKLFKQEFENVKLKTIREFRSRLSDVSNAAFDELFRSLDEELFKPEDAKATALIDGLKDIPEQNCITRLRDFYSDVKNKEGKSEFKCCALEFDSDSKQVKEKLNAAQESINALTTQAEQKIQNCLRVYNLRRNLTQLEDCVRVQAQINLKKAPINLENSLKNLTVQQSVIKLATCFDKTFSVIQKSLNANYDLIKKCLDSSSSCLAKQISPLVLSYKNTLTSSAVSQVSEAMLKLKANSSEVLQSCASTKLKIELVSNRRNRNTDTIKGLFMNYVNVVKYLNALYSASLQLSTISNAQSCLTDAQSRFQETMNARANDLKKCQDGIKQTISVGDVTSLENSLMERLKTEAQVSTVLCLSSSGITAQNSTITCSAQLDVSFENYLASIAQNLEVLNQRATVMMVQIDSCEKAINPSILFSLATNKYQLEICILNRAARVFSLSYE